MTQQVQLAPYIKDAAKLEVFNHIVHGGQGITIREKVRHDAIPHNGKAFTGWELRGSMAATGRAREIAFYVWFFPDQEFTYREGEPHDVFDEEGVVVQVRFHGLASQS